MSGEAYDRFMGRYSRPLARELVDLLGVARGSRALDVGCGPGALTGVLADHLGSARVHAVDPSTSFVDACRAAHPGVDVRQAHAESLPFEDDHFDVAAANLVVHFMADPVAGLREMARVTRPGCWVAATVWDLAGGRAPMAPAWDLLEQVASQEPGEDHLAGGTAGQLEEFLAAAGLSDVAGTELAVTVTHPTFEEWWTPYLAGVGPAGEVIQRLEDGVRGRLEAALRERMGEGLFDITAVAFAARGRV